jgi:hypothetical protein
MAVRQRRPPKLSFEDNGIPKLELGNEERAVAALS